MNKILLNRTLRIDLNRLIYKLESKHTAGSHVSSPLRRMLIQLESETNSSRVLAEVANDNHLEETHCFSKRGRGKIRFRNSRDARE